MLVSLSALKVALAKLMVVRVCPRANVQTSLIPASSSTFLLISPVTSPIPWGAGLRVTLTLPAVPGDLHGNGMGNIAPAFPAAAATLDPDEVHLRLDDRLLDRIADLHVLALTEPDVAVAVADYDNCTELDTAARVGHPLHHRDIENFVLKIGKERVNDLGFLDRPAACEDLIDALDLSRSDKFAKTGDRMPFFSLYAIYAISFFMASATCSTTLTISPAFLLYAAICAPLMRSSEGRISSP